MLETTINDGVVIGFVRTYHRWRLTYGVLDSCMEELIAAIRAAAEEDERLNDEQTERLFRLAAQIETERRLAKELVA